MTSTKKVFNFLIITALFTLLGWGSLWLLTRAGLIVANSPLFFGLLVLGGSAPTYSAFIAIAISEGRAGFKAFWPRLFRVKVHVGYYLFAFVYLVLLGILPDVLTGELGIKLAAVSQFNWLILPLVLLSSFLIGGLEEVGWRGLLQDELQKSLPSWAVHLIIWIIWSLWHFPLFHISGVSQFGQSFLIFSVYALLYSTLLGWLFGRTQSVPLTVFGHMLMNTLATVGVLDFLWKGILDWRAVVIALAVLVAMHLAFPIKQFQEAVSV